MDGWMLILKWFRIYCCCCCCYYSLLNMYSLLGRGGPPPNFERLALTSSLWFIHEIMDFYKAKSMQQSPVSRLVVRTRFITHHSCWLVGASTLHCSLRWVDRLCWIMNPDQVNPLFQPPRAPPATDKTNVQCKFKLFGCPLLSQNKSCVLVSEPDLDAEAVVCSAAARAPSQIYTSY